MRRKVRKVGSNGNLLSCIASFVFLTFSVVKVVYHA